MWGVSLTHPVLFFFLIFFYWGSFFYTSHAGFIFIGGVSLQHPVLTFFFFFIWVFLLQIPCWHRFFVCFFWFVFLCVCVCVVVVDLWSFSYTSRAVSFCVGGVSLTHPMLGSFLSGVFLVHIPYWLLFCLGSFSYTSRAGCFVFCLLLLLFCF